MEFFEHLGKQVLATVIFSLLGVLTFAVVFNIIVHIAPSIRKEIEQDQNTALAVLIGSVILGIAVIIAASIHG